MILTTVRDQKELREQIELAKYFIQDDVVDQAKRIIDDLSTGMTARDFNNLLFHLQGFAKHRFEIAANGKKKWEANLDLTEFAKDVRMAHETSIILLEIKPKTIAS